MKLSTYFIAGQPDPYYRSMVSCEDCIAFTSHSAVIVYSNTVGKNLALLKTGESVRCNALTFPYPGTIFAGYVNGHLVQFKGQPTDPSRPWTATSIQKLGSGVLSLIDFNGTAMPICADGTVGREPKIKFPSHHRVELGCQVGKSLVALGSVDKCIHIYDPASWEYLTSLKGHSMAVSSLASLEYQGGVLLASSSKDGAVRVWRLQLHEGRVTALLESILSGHQGSVTGLGWRNGQQLVSCSFDSSVQIWTREPEGWISKVRLGQMAGSKNAFFGLCLSGEKVAAVTYTGAVYCWAEVKDKWQTYGLMSGHSEIVSDIDVDSKGARVVTCSADKTTRVYARVDGSWVQLSRAQVHGYEVNRIRFKPACGWHPDICDLLVCGADEKVLRVLEPPARFINLNNLRSKSIIRMNTPDQSQQKRLLQCQKTMQYKVMAESRTQALGLLTKKDVAGKDQSIDFQEEEDAGLQEEGQASDGTSSVPCQDFLVRNTLWPELQKVYGHPNEISALAVSDLYVASACKALCKRDAALILWEPKTFKLVARIEAHKSTITDIDFGKGQLYSVSRDRQLARYSMTELRLEHIAEVHARQIAFVKVSPDGSTVMTGSRDRLLKLFRYDKQVARLQFQCGVSAGVFLDQRTGVVGLENGQLAMVVIGSDSAKVAWISSLHAGRVTRLAALGPDQVVSGGDDHTMQIHKVVRESSQ